MIAQCGVGIFDPISRRSLWRTKRELSVAEEMGLISLPEGTYSQDAIGVRSL
jgi:hypothetical protein